MTKYGLIAAVVLSILGAAYEYVPVMKQEYIEYGEMKAEVKWLRIRLGECVENDGE